MIPCTRLLTGQRFLPFKDIATVTGVCTYSTIDVFPWCTRAGRMMPIMWSTCYWTGYNCNILSGLEHSSLSSFCQQPQSVCYHYTFIEGKDQPTHKPQKFVLGITKAQMCPECLLFSHCLAGHPSPLTAPISNFFKGVSLTLYHSFLRGPWGTSKRSVLTQNSSRAEAYSFATTFTPSTFQLWVQALLIYLSWSQEFTPKCAC